MNVFFRYLLSVVIPAINTYSAVCPFLRRIFLKRSAAQDSFPSNAEFFFFKIGLFLYIAAGWNRFLLLCRNQTALETAPREPPFSRYTQNTQAQNK